jgi:hypothetical protein
LGRGIKEIPASKPFAGRIADKGLYRSKILLMTEKNEIARVIE